jgi:hypothetical protein
MTDVNARALDRELKRRSAELLILAEAVRRVTGEGRA